MRSVVRLSIAPVKSLGLLHPPEIRLGPSGVEDNRRFHLVDARGNLFTGTKFGPLVAIRSRWDAERDLLTLELPDGTTVEGDAAATGEAVVTLFYGRPVPGHVVEGPFAAALSAHAGEPIRLVRSDRPGDANDVWPATLLSTASAEELSRRSGSDRPRDTRRFRMLIEIDGCAPHEEDTWDGRAVRVGEARLRIRGPVPRCQVTQQDPGSGRRDFATLREIKAYRGLDPDGEGIDFGVYGEVLEPGVVRVGDVVEPEEGP